MRAAGEAGPHWTDGAGYVPVLQREPVMLGYPLPLPPTPSVEDRRKAHAEEVRRKLGELQERQRTREPRPVGEWPDGVDVASRLTLEAAAMAARLGHKLSEWHWKDGEWRARCLTCSAPVVVSPREFRRAPIRGEGVTFRCR